MLTIQIICILFFFYFTFFWMENILVQYLLNSSFIDSAFFLDIFGAIEAIVRT